MADIVLRIPKSAYRQDESGGITLRIPNQAPAAPPSNAPTGMREKLAGMEQPGMFDGLLAKLPGADANIRGSAVGGYMMGAADPSIGAAQFVANLVGAGDGINKPIAGKEAQYQDARASAGRDGFDGARLAGNVAGPSMLVGGVGKTVASPVVRGAIQGGLGALAMPVTDGGQNYATDKATQGVVGVLSGGAMGKVFDKAANSLSTFVGKMRAENRTVDPEAVAAQVKFALEKDGIDASAIPKNILESVRQDVSRALRSGEKIDPAALARKMDFESLGMTGTRGQITRDPMQFAREKNLQGIVDAGEPLAAVFNQQPKQLAGALDKLGAASAREGTADAAALQDRLLRNDEFSRALVDRAYKGARDETGRYAGANVKAFSDAANNALDEQMLGRFLPANVKGLLNDVSDGTVPLNVNTLVQIDGVFSDAQRAAMSSGDKAGAKAIGVIRSALNNTPIDDAAGAQAKAAFDTARGLARDRFQNIESVPALKATLDDVAPDKFIQKYIIGADSRDVAALKGMIEGSPEASQLIRNQVVAHLKNKAFGANAAGDKGFAQETFNKELKNIGREKLLSIFTPDEVDKLFTVGRVAAYAGSQPAGSVVNTSGTAAAAMNLLAKIGKVPYLRELGVKPLENALARKEAVAAASGVVPVEPLAARSAAVDGARNRLAGPLAFGAGAVSAPRKDK